MCKKFRANFDSFCEILDHLEQFWSSDHYGAGLLQISKKIKCLSPEIGRVNFILWIKTYRNRQISSRAIHRYQKNEIGSVVVENEPPKVGEISEKSSYKKCKTFIDFGMVKKNTIIMDTR